MKARLIHTELNKNQIPISWTYPQQGTFEGAQVISDYKALNIFLNGDNEDDWYSDGQYTHIAFLDVDGYSGDKGPLTYKAIKEDDLNEMKVLSKQELQEALFEIAEEIDTEDVWDDLGFPNESFIIDEYTDRIIDKANTIEPEFVNTL